MEKVKSFILFAVVIIVTAFLTWIAYQFLPEQGVVQDFFSSFPMVLSVALFIVIYVLSSFVIIDLKDILKIAGALIFGAVGSSVCIWMAELINSVLLFFLARILGRAWIERRFHLKGRDVMFVSGMCGMMQISVLRFIPLIPYRILDLAYGLTGVSFKRYFTVSALCSPFRIFWFQFIAAGIGGAVLDSNRLMVFLQERPVALKFSLIYIVVSLFGAFVLLPRFKKMD